MSRLLTIAWFLCSMTTHGLACSYIPDERSWNQRIADEPVIFVGKVIALLDPEGMAAMGRNDCGPDGIEPDFHARNAAFCAIFSVDQVIRGARAGKTFEVPQGQGADCGIVYDIGQRWLFAGSFIGGPSQQLSGLLSKQQIAAIKRALR